MKKKLAVAIAKHAPTMLSSVAAFGVIATGVLSARAAYKTADVVKRKTSTVDKVKEAAPSYILPAGICLGTVVCIVASLKISKKGLAAMAASYALIQNSYSEYQKKVKELYGDEAFKKIHDEIVDDHFEEDPVENIEVTKKDGVLFYESYSRQFFRSSIEKVQAAEYHLNRNFILRGYAPINEFLDFLGIKKMEGGDDIGWSWDIGADWGYEWIDFEHRTKVKDGETYYIIDYMFGAMSLWWESYK